MGSGLQLLPGEKVELSRRPSPWSWLGKYARAISWLAWGALVASLAASWDTAYAGNATAWWSVLAACQLAAAGPLLVAAVLERVRHKWLLPGTIVAMSLAAIGTALAAWANALLPLPLALGLGHAAIALLAVAWAEARRATTWVHVTNIRFVAQTRWPRRMDQVRHAELQDLDVRQGPLGRALDVGTLVAVTAQGSLAVPGVQPFARVRRLVQLLVRRATATEYLREEQGLDAEVADAMAALQRR